MTELLEANWPLFIIALLLGIAVAWRLFVATRRTKVSGDRGDVLDEGADPAARNQALIDSPPSTSTQSSETQREPANQPEDATEGDDLTRIKGVGPKLRDLLISLGVTKFSQIAEWTDADIDRVDARLGQFEGRIRRDDWRAQASLLASDDTDGYEQKFGKL